MKIKQNQKLKPIDIQESRVSVKLHSLGNYTSNLAGGQMCFCRLNSWIIHPRRYHTVSSERIVLFGTAARYGSSGTVVA